MNEGLPFPDTEPDFVTTPEAKALRTGVIDIAKRYGSERLNRDGYTATFQVDGQRILTCRYITKTGEYARGVYVSYWETLAEYEDGSSIQLNREYEVSGKSHAVYFSERAVHYDADENEVPFSPERPEGMSILIWNRMLRKQQAEGQKFAETFDDHSFYRYQAEELLDMLSSLGEAHLVACEDETVDGL